MKLNSKNNFSRRSTSRLLRRALRRMVVERLEDRSLLAGHGVAFFVNGFNGAQIPEDVYNHLVGNLLADTNADWNKNNDGHLDIYQTNWNSPDPTFQSGYPGGFFGVDTGYGFSASIVNTVLLGVPIPYGITIDPIVKSDPVGPSAFVDSVVEILETEYDDSDFIVLIGHSLGGNSILEIAQKTFRQIDFLATLDPVGFTNSPDDAASQNLVLFDGYTVDAPDWAGGGSYEILPKISVNIPSETLTDVVAGDFHDPVRGTPGYRKDLPQPSQGNVGYFYNRWQEKFLFPIDRARSGFLPGAVSTYNVNEFALNGAPISAQANASTTKNADGSTFTKKATAMDVLFGYSHLDVDLPSVDFTSLPPTYDGGSVGFSDVDVQNHSSLPLDALIQTELMVILNNIVPLPPVARAGADYSLDEGSTGTLNASASTDPNPHDVLTYRWRQVSGPYSVTITDRNSPIASFKPLDDGDFVFEVTVSDGFSDETDRVTVEVRNVDPVVTPISGPSEAVRGFPVTFVASFFDPGTRDTHTVDWTFGDGSGFVSEELFAQGPFSQEHLFEDKGDFLVQAVVVDDDGGFGESPEKSVKVKAAGLVPNKDNPALLDLLVGGTTSNDVVIISPAAGNSVRVVIEGELNEVFAPTGSILVNAQRGDDRIVIEPGLGLPVFVAGGRGLDQIEINGASAASPVWVEGNQGDDRFIISSTNGLLADIAGKVTIIGGSGINSLQVFDSSSEQPGLYQINPTQVQKGLANIVYEDIDMLSLVAGRASDTLAVIPSEMTNYSLDGNSPGSVNGRSFGRDFLLLEQPSFEHWSVHGPSVTFTTMVEGRQTAGLWSFDSTYRPIQFAGIERFNLLDKLISGSDAAWDALAGVQIDSPLLGTPYSNLVSNFTPTPLTPFSLLEFPTPAVPGHSSFQGFLSRSDVNLDGVVTAVDALAIINELLRTGSQPVSPAQVHLDINGDGFITAMDALIAINALKYLSQSSSTFGGIRTTAADVNGDGVEEIIAVSGANHIPTMLVFNGVTGRLIGSPIPLSEAAGNNFGMYVAAGDIDGDGWTEVLTSSDRGPAVYTIWRWVNGSLVKVAERGVNYTAGYQGGVRVATGDLNGDGVAEILVGSGTGTAANVRAYNSTGVELAAFQLSTSFGRGGVNIATGDYNGDGISDLFVASGRRGGSQVQVFNGAAGLNGLVGSSHTIRSVYTGQDALAPISITLKDADGDGVDVLYTSQLSDGRSKQVKRWTFNEAADRFFESLETELQEGVFPHRNVG